MHAHLFSDKVDGVAGGLDDALLAVLAGALRLLDVCLLQGGWGEWEVGGRGEAVATMI